MVTFTYQHQNMNNVHGPLVSRFMIYSNITHIFINDKYLNMWKHDYYSNGTSLSQIFTNNFEAREQRFREALHSTNLSNVIRSAKMIVFFKLIIAIAFIIN